MPFKAWMIEVRSKEERGCDLRKQGKNLGIFWIFGGLAGTGC